MLNTRSARVGPSKNLGVNRPTCDVKTSRDAFTHELPLGGRRQSFRPRLFSGIQ